MKHRLILMIGKGQPVLLKDGKLTYRTASYILPGKPANPIVTPIVGEAIVQLYQKESFDQLHILGTKDSMWSTLYGHCINPTLTDLELQTFENLDSVMGTDDLNDIHLKKIGDSFQRKIGIPTTCHLIAVGKSESELWEIFSALISLPKAGDKVSVDITHGLRFQPFIMVLAMAYFRTIKNRVKWGRAFYGAYEMSHDYFEGLSPVFDLSPMLTMLEWLYAAQAFRDYGDVFPAAHLLKDSPLPEAQTFNQRAKEFTHSVQFYDSKEIPKAAKKFIQSIEKLTALEHPGMEPLAFIADSLKVFPERLSRIQPHWKMFLQLAHHHLRNEGQFGLAILATWEAVIRRFAEVYGVSHKHFGNYLTLSKIARGKKAWPLSLIPARLRKFPQKTSQLGAFRHVIAHTESGEFSESTEILEEFPEVFAYMKTYLPDPDLELLRSLLPFVPKTLK